MTEEERASARKGSADTYPAGSPRNRWLPEGRRGPMPWIIAIIIFLTLLAGAAALGLAHALIQMRGELAGGYTIQVIEPNAERQAAQVARITAYLKTQRTVRTVAVVPERQLREQIEPWIGTGTEPGELPIPALIDVDLEPGTQPGRIALIERTVTAIAPGARVDAHERYLAPVEQLMRTLMWLAAALVAMMTAVTAAVVMLVARSSYETHRATIDVIHLLGATDLQIARLFQRRIALDVLFGALIGTAAAVSVLWFMGRSLAATGADMAMMISVPWRLTPLLLAIPILSLLLAATTARITVKRALERTL